MASEESRAVKLAEQQRAARVDTCTRELRALLERHRCTLQVQGMFIQRAGQPRQEDVQIGVVALDVEAPKPQ
jgi:hypothetical protein